jgi:sodium transport system permease protein
MAQRIRPSIVLTIFRREVVDQVRDRRTLFMVFVLPILLYPILGIGALQISAGQVEKSRRVVLVGFENLPRTPALLNAAKDGFNPSFFVRPRDAERLKVLIAEPGSAWARPEAASLALRDRLADAVLTIPPDAATRIAESGLTRLPIQYDSTDELGALTYALLRDVIESWRDAIVDARLVRDGKPTGYVEPVKVSATDVAPPSKVGVNVWSRIFPFLLVLMTLTGAFYPAIDLCAGEKERGTMETLLISPASRTEIVLGKYLTVILASVTMAMLNLVSMGLTGIQIAAKLAAIGPKAGGRTLTIIAPPAPSSYLWIMLLLIPLAAFFSAVCLALAVLARSMKEGQYYMTPLYLVTLPLILVTMMPEVSLNLFYSVVPITGVSLLLKSLILGEYDLARRYFLAVLIPTILYGWLALRWAVDLFRREDVVFREAEAFDLASWARHLVRDKEPRPGAGAAIFCFAAMLCLAWFLMQGLSTGVSPLAGMLLGHLVFILGPPVLLAFLLTSDPLGTLRIRRCRWVELGLAAALALFLNPLVRELSSYVGQLFPASQAIQSQLEELAKQIPNLGVALLVFAVMPAITEEVAFRGFILSGLRKSYSSGSAIVISAFLFGFLHVLLSLFQQLFAATLLGLILGWVALRTRSLWPGVIFHLINNALGVLTEPVAKQPELARWLFRPGADALYQPAVVVGSSLVAAVLLFLFWKLPAAASKPETAADLLPEPAG